MKYISMKMLPKGRIPPNATFTIGCKYLREEGEEGKKERRRREEGKKEENEYEYGYWMGYRLPT